MSKVIPGEQTGKVIPWRVPELGPGRGFTPRPSTHDLTHASGEQLEALRAAAQREGFEAGLKQAEDVLSQQREQLNALLHTLAEPLQKLNDQVEQELLELAMATAKQILRREITIDPKHVIGQIREALRQIPLASREIRIRLHPEDAAVVRQTLSDPSDAQRLIIEDNPALPRGGCQVHTETSFVDASIDAMVARLSASLLGGRRKSDNDPESAA